MDPEIKDVLGSPETGTAKEKRDYLLPASIIAAGVMISGSIIYLVGSGSNPLTTGSPQDQLAAAEADLPADVGGRDVILGNSNAPVTLIEYGDFQCPFCAKFHSEVSPGLREEYIKTGKVRMVFRNFQFLGPESVAAAEAAECAKDQENFWAFHDAIYNEELRDGRENNGNLKKDLFLKFAEGLGLNVKNFTECVDAGRYSKQVAQDRDAAAAAGVNSTPITFINSEMIRGALPYDSFKAVIDRFLAE